MLREINIARLIVLLGGIMFCCVAQAQQPAPGFDEALGRQAFQVVENWVRRARVPDQTLGIEATGVRAVQVTLRREGVTLGQGHAAVDDPRAQVKLPAVDIMPLLQSAVRDAMRELVQSINEVSQLTEVAQQVQLDIQFVAPVQPVRINRLAELPRAITLDLDGLALFDGHRWAWVFPGNRIAANTNLQGQLNHLLGDLNLPPTQLASIGQPNGPSLYRFRVTHLVQPEPGAKPDALYRGNVLWPPSPLNDAALKLVRGQLLEHLLKRHIGQGVFAGTYEPTADRYNPPTARPVDAALAAYALARVSNLKTLQPALREQALEVCTAAVIELAAEEQDLAGTALTLMAMLESPEAASLKGPRLRLATTIGRMQQPDGHFNLFDRAPAADGGGRSATLSADALAAAALTAYYDRTRDPNILRLIQRALDAIWKQIDASSDPSDELAATLPWLINAEIRLARIGKATARYPVLAGQLMQVVKGQVRPWAVGADDDAARDIVGGYPIGVGLFDEPDWQTARVLTAQSMLLQAPDLIAEKDRPQWLVSASMAARFIAQLNMQAPSCYYVRNPTEAIGGTRTAFWDNRQPLYATAMSLLAITELEQSLQR
ncbi:hypothetical protein HED60_24510 [Planctomycetales bacterium ZRK34]|nr:hypothetical protein HED60_24510 [Planctomycetales bacterium ZRK34]